MSSSARAFGQIEGSSMAGAMMKAVERRDNAAKKAAG